MENSEVKTINRLVEILDHIALENGSLSLADLSTQLKMPKSTLHRFLTGLESHGILRRDEDDKKWRLGYHLIVWGSAAEENSALREIARPVMGELVVSTGETAILTVYQNHEVTCIDMCETNHPVRLKMEVGTNRPAHAGASSKVLLAHLREQEVMEIVKEKGLPKLYINTITDASELLAELARIRERGYADSLEETDPGAWGVATPIWDLRGKLVGAVGVAGPTMRYSKDKVVDYAALCRDASNKITARFSAGILPAPRQG
jgi:IclR family transcriptional regulator, KDG regulon repressor